MRKLLVPLRVVAIAATLALGGCLTDGVGVSVFKGGTSLTASITNPVGRIDIYRVKNVYAATLSAVADYREFCWGKPYSVLMTDPVSKVACQNRRGIVRTLQAADLKAFAAIEAADKFARNNPTISAASAVGAAWTAVSDFQNIAVRFATAVQ